MWVITRSRSRACPSGTCCAMWRDRHASRSGGSGSRRRSVRILSREDRLAADASSFQPYVLHNERMVSKLGQMTVIDYVQGTRYVDSPKVQMRKPCGFVSTENRDLRALCPPAYRHDANLLPYPDQGIWMGTDSLSLGEQVVPIITQRTLRQNIPVLPG
jgi:hypothetical protein